MSSDGFGIVGCGYALPDALRGNDDPVFAHVSRQEGWDNTGLFTGLRHRRVLADGETIEPLMVRAAQSALTMAQSPPGSVSRLYGYATVPAYLTPNGLYQVHRDLGLPSSAWVIPINAEFSAFVAGLILATEAAAAGTAGNMLVVCGSNWTRHLDYTKGHAYTAGDAAGAAVLGPHGRLIMRGHLTRTYPALYESLTMTLPSADIGGQGTTAAGRGVQAPVYRMHDELGARMFSEVMRDGIPELVTQLLRQTRVPASDITLITHQGSRALLDHWAERIAPAVYAESLQQLGNMTTATYPVNLARAFTTLTTTYVVIAAVGTGAHLTAAILQQA